MFDTFVKRLLTQFELDLFPDDSEESHKSELRVTDKPYFLKILKKLDAGSEDTRIKFLDDEDESVSGSWLSPVIDAVQDAIKNTSGIYVRCLNRVGDDSVRISITFGNNSDVRFVGTIKTHQFARIIKSKPRKAT